MGRVQDLLRVAREGRGTNVGGDHPTVVLDREPGASGFAARTGAPWWIVVHDRQGEPGA